MAEAKAALDAQTAQLNARVVQLRATERWMEAREGKVRRMERQAEAARLPERFDGGGGAGHDADTTGDEEAFASLRQLGEELDRDLSVRIDGGGPLDASFVYPDADASSSVASLSAPSPPSYPTPSGYRHRRRRHPRRSRRARDRDAPRHAYGYGPPPGAHPHPYAAWGAPAHPYAAWGAPPPPPYAVPARYSCRALALAAASWCLMAFMALKSGCR